MEKKLSGSYYTPQIITEFIYERCHKKLTSRKCLDVLEPSCGDGAFLLPFISNRYKREYRFTLVEKDSMELSKAVDRYNTLSLSGKVEPNRTSYLNFHFENKNRYDLIIGNPPYINKTLLDKGTIELAKKVIDDCGFKKSKPRNIWLIFLMSAIKKVKDDGIISFVLPSEIIHVNHSQELRELLSLNFDAIEIFTFKEPIFKDILQDAVVLFAYKSSTNKGLRVYQIDRLQDLVQDNHYNGKIDKYSNNDKWTKFFLKNKDLAFIESLKGNFKKVKDFCSSVTGIVTGANKYFILDSKTVEEYSLQQYVKPILQKSYQSVLGITYSENDFNELKSSDIPCFLLELNHLNSADISGKLADYLESGVEQGIDRRFKCAKRKDWFKIPLVWSPEAFFFRRAHKFHKLLLNKDNILVTDSAYRIRMNKGFDIKRFIFSYYNSFTLLSAEIFGRFYGGGVLELIPNEFKELPLPYCHDITDADFELLDQMFREKKDIDEILQFTDKILLEDYMGLSYDKVELIKQLRQQMMNLRLKR